MSTAYNAAHQFRSQLTGVAGGTHGTLTAKTVVGGVFDAADTTIPAVTAGAAVVAVVTYKDTGNAATDALISYQEIASTTPDGSDVTAQWPTTGVFRFLAPGINASVSVPMLTPARVIGTPIVTALPISGGLSVRITRTADGATATYIEAAATILDDYNDPDGQFVMGCKVSPTNPIFPQFRIWFRTDKVGTPRDEIIAEYSVCHAGNVTNFPIMTGYTAEIRKNGVLIVTKSVPYHSLQMRWRWYSSERPVRKTVIALTDAGLLPLYDASKIMGGDTPPTPVYPYNGPMDLANLVNDMNAGGNHPEIGVITDTQADYICNGRNWATVRDQAEASGTYPYHHRDENTGAPLHMFNYPHASVNNAASPTEPYLPKDWALNPSNPDRVTVLNADDPHMPSLAYVPFLFTGDPYYLEEQQFVVNFQILQLPWNTRGTYNVYSAIRANAWSSRSCAQALVSTPDSVPNWLLPKSYFQRQLDGCRDWMLETYIDSPLAAVSVAYDRFRTIEPGFYQDASYMQPYMEDYVAWAQAHIVQLFPDDAGWRRLFEWKVQNSISRSNNLSGWPRAVGSPYRHVPRALATDPYLSWAESYTLTKSLYPIPPFSDPNVMANPGGDLTYPSLLMCVLAMASRLGVTDADEPLAWHRLWVGTYAQAHNGWVNWKFATG